MQLTITETKKLLRNLQTGVKIELTETPDGEIMLTAEKQTKAEIIADKFPRLVGKPITLSEAAKKYGVPRTTLQKWHYRSNYISPIDSNVYPMFFDESEIAYLSDIYSRRKSIGSKAPLLDDDGLPYELKHPELANYRRKKKTL